MNQAETRTRALFSAAWLNSGWCLECSRGSGLIYMDLTKRTRTRLLIFNDSVQIMSVSPKGSLLTAGAVEITAEIRGGL